MANLKAIRKRIQGVTGTQQLTRAMKLVAAAKLRRAQEAALAQRAYADALADVIHHLAPRLESEDHPLLARREVRRCMLLIFTSDRGLCGAFNLNVCREAEKFVAARSAQGQEVLVSVIGKKGYEHLVRRHDEVHRYYDDMFADISFETISRIGNELAKDYTEGGYDALHVIYNWFRSPAVQRVTERRILPVDLSEQSHGEVARVEHLFEPDKKGLLDALFPMYFNIQLFQALLESVASEMGARMTAMDNATNNASDLIRRLTLAYNKARQETITKELMDIVGGAEALD